MYMKTHIMKLHTKKFILLTVVFLSVPLVSLGQPFIKGISEARALPSLEKQVEMLRLNNPGVELSVLENTIQYLHANPTITDIALDKLAEQEAANTATAIKQAQQLLQANSVAVVKPPLRRPVSTVTLENGPGISLKKVMDKLVTVPVPGYGTYFKNLKRNDFLAMGHFGLNLQRIVDMHLKIYPNSKTISLPKGFDNLIKTTRDANDIILHDKGATGWQELRDPTRQMFFESGLPAALIEPADELVIPTFTQMDVAQTYWLEVANGHVEKQVWAENGFAQYVSAATNLGLFGTPDTALAILKMAKRNYGLFDLWKDYFFTRALLNLGAYNELKELADFRLNETDSNRDPKQLAAVWSGIQEMTPKKFRLQIPSGRIAPKDEPIPELLQNELLLHHPFAYVLLNGSQEVTELWQDVRHVLDDNFAKAAIQTGAGTLLANQLAQLNAKPKYVAPAPRIEYDEPEEDFDEEEIFTDEDNIRTPDEEITPTREPSQPQYRRVSLPSKKTIRTPAQVRQELAEYIEQHDGNLPPHHSALRQAAHKLALQTSSTENPDIRQIQEMMRKYSVYKKLHTPAQARKELEEYIQTHNGQFPPNNSSMLQKIRKMRQEFPNDPDIVAINQMMSARRQASKSQTRTPVVAQTRKLLENYLKNNHGHLPPAGDPLRTLIYKTFRTEDASDADVIALRTLWQSHLQVSTRTPANVRQELEIYLQKHNNQLPRYGTALRAAAYKISKSGDPSDPDVQAIINILKIQPYSKNNKTAADCRAELETYFATNTSLPTTSTPLNTLAYKIMKTEDPSDPDVIAIKEMWQAHKKQNPYRKIKPEELPAPQITQALPQTAPHEKNAKRTPQQIYDELVVYLQEHNNKLPPGTTSLRHAITYIIDYGDRSLPEVNQIIDLYNQHLAVVPRSAKQVRDELSIYIANQEPIPTDGALYQAIYKITRKGDPNDPDVIAIKEMWEKHRQRTRRTPKQVYEEVVSYVNKNGKLPPVEHPLNNAYRHLMTKRPSSDPHIEALSQFWKSHAQQIIPAEERAPLILTELKNYLQENGRLPANGTSLRNAANHLRRIGDPDNAHIAAITRLLNENKIQVEVQRTPEKVYQALQEYLQTHNGDLPPARHPLRNSYYHVINHVEGDQQTLSDLKDLWQSHVKNIKRTPIQVRTELEQYIQEHDGKLPPIRTALRQAAYRLSLTRTTTDPDIEMIKKLLQLHLR